MSAVTLPPDCLYEPTAQPPTQKPTRFQRLTTVIVCQAMQHFKNGQLQMTLPDGSVRCFGNPHIVTDVTNPLINLRASINVKDHTFFERMCLSADIGLAESYMMGEWDSSDVAGVLRWFIMNLVNAFPEGNLNQLWQVNLLRWANRLQHRLRPNHVSGSQQNIQSHYDLSNRFFSLFLDPTLAYSSAKYMDENEDLQTAQQNKFESLCQKLRLRPSDHLLEIGSGWGGFAVYAASQYGCRITTITISPAQYEGAKAHVASAGMTDRVEVLLQDYRHVQGQYDKIVSVEMIEAVGDAYFENFFAQCHRLLKPAGLLGLQMITCPDSRYPLLKSHVDFIQKHIFPGSLLPSIDRIQQALRKTGDLFLHELEDLGNSYARTLSVWDDNFMARLDDVRALGFDNTFIRKWHYYLQYCEAAFSTRNITVVQAVYTRANNPVLTDALPRG